MTDRNKLYLSNFSLLNVEPANSLTICLKQQMTESAFQSILSLAKQWYIKRIIIRPEIASDGYLMEFIDRMIDEEFLFKPSDFTFHVDLSTLAGKIMHSHWQNEFVNNDDLLLPLLIHTSDYEVQQKGWGRDLVRFNSKRPEVYRSVRTRRKKLSLQLYSPAHVEAIFIAPAYERKTRYSDLVDVTDNFNPVNGLLKVDWSLSPMVDVYILRLVDGYLNDYPQAAFNIFEKDFLGRYLEQHLELSEKTIRKFSGLVIRGIAPTGNLDMLPLNEHLIDTMADGNEREFYKRALTLWHYFPDAPSRMAHAVRQFYFDQTQQLISKEITHHKNFANKNLHYLITPGKSNEWLINENDSISLNATGPANIDVPLDDVLFYPSGSYAKAKEKVLKLASSAHHLLGHNEPTVHWSSLLNLFSGFDRKSWQLNWLLSNGITRFNLNTTFPFLDSNLDFYENIPTSDPSFNAYSDWYSYVNQMAHFMRSGDHRADILVLYPTQSYWLNNQSNIDEILMVLANSALDYDLIDFQSFINDRTTIIEDQTLSIGRESFSFLIIPSIKYIPIDAMRKINRFYQNGGTVIAIGDLPESACDPQYDVEVRALSNEVWFEKSSVASTKFKTSNNDGRGYYQSRTNKLTEIFEYNRHKLNIFYNQPDAQLRIIVRELPKAYHIFLFNPSPEKQFKGEILSRFKGLPFEWDFKSAEPRSIYNWRIKEHLMHLPVHLRPKAMKMLILQKSSLKLEPQILSTNLNTIDEMHIDKNDSFIIGTVKKDGDYNCALQLATVTVKNSIKVEDHLPVLKINEENWHITINGKTNTSGLGDLSSIEPFFSGTAIYRKIIIIPQQYVEQYRLFLDLGKLNDWVKVVINDKTVGSSVIPPFEFDITKFVKAGENTLRFEINNNISNRLAAQQGAQEKGLIIRQFGLFGPVKVIPWKKVQITF